MFDQIEGHTPALRQLAELQKTQEISIFYFLCNIATQELGILQAGSSIHSYEYPITPEQKLNLQVAVETLGSKPEEKLNEDSYFDFPLGPGRHLFGIVDGATSQKPITGLERSKVKGAFVLSHVATHGFADSDVYADLCARSYLTAGTVMTELNYWLMGQLTTVEGISYDDVLTVPGGAATLVLVDTHQAKVTTAHVADTVGMVEGSDGSMSSFTPNQNEVFDDETMRLARKLAHLHGLSLAQVRNHPLTKPEMDAQLHASARKKVNTPQGCGILNGMPELINHGLIHETTIPLNEELAAIYLLSDGALLPYLTTHRTPEDAILACIETMHEKGNVGSDFLKYGHQLLSDDPDHTLVPRLKRHDDATVMCIQFEIAPRRPR